MTIERGSAVTSAVIAALVSGCGPQARPGGGTVGACAAEAAHCTAAVQCCSDRCELSRGATAGVCTSPAELDGPFAALPADRKRADLRLDPPAVLEASAVAGPDGGSIVNVRFADDPRLGPTVALTSDDGPLVLHDDGTAGDARAGDRIYAAALPVAFAQLQADERRVLADLARRQVTQVPQFDGPEIVATDRPAGWSEIYRQGGHDKDLCLILRGKVHSSDRGDRVAVAHRRHRARRPGRAAPARRRGAPRA